MRRLISGFLALLLVLGVSSVITPANAMVEYMEYDYFFIYKGGPPAISNKFVTKWDDQRAPMYTAVWKYPGSDIDWLSNETVYWRGRSETLARATALGTTNVGVERNLSYLSGFGTRLTEYTIAAEYADSNPYTKLEVIIYWDS